MVATLVVMVAEKIALANALKPVGNLLKEFRNFASIHPKAVTDYLVDRKQTEPHTEGTIKFLMKYTPPCSPAMLFSGLCTFQIFLPPFSGYVMAICYRLLYSETCLKPVLSVFIEFFVTFFWHYIIFFWLTYPCMIILKYNQTFGLLFFSSLLTQLSFFYIYICVPLCSVIFLSNITKAQWICTVTPTPMEMERVQRKRATYNQVFWSVNPSPLIRTFMGKSIRSHDCVFDRTLPLGVWTVDGFDPLFKPPPRGRSVFSVGPLRHTLETSFSSSTAAWDHLAVFLDFEKKLILKEKKNSNWISVKRFTCLQTGVFSSFWVYKGVASDYVLLFSEVVGRGAGKDTGVGLTVYCL